ncbi:MAG: DUF1761 domain-containing protein [Gemmatimonadales bacterium]
MYGITFNYLAVLVAALATFALGALWYMPLFGKLWLKEHAYTPAQLEQMKGTAPRAYGVSFAAYLVVALVLSALIQLTGIIRWQGGLKLGALCWLGFAATIGLTANMYSEKKFSTFVIDAGYQLVYLMMMGAILAAWR